MHEALQNIQDDLGYLSKAQFLEDGKTQRAVIQSIIVIGEAANHIMQLVPTIEQSHPEVWRHFKDACGMRIILTHEYFRVDASVVWDTVQTELPELVRLLARSVLQ